MHVNGRQKGERTNRLARRSHNLEKQLPSCDMHSLLTLTAFKHMIFHQGNPLFHGTPVYKIAIHRLPGLVPTRPHPSLGAS